VPEMSNAFLRCGIDFRSVSGYLEEERSWNKVEAWVKAAGVKSGLRVVEGILGEIEDVSFQRLTAHDVVRHKLVGEIVAAYDEFDARASTGSSDGSVAPARDARR